MSRAVILFLNLIIFLLVAGKSKSQQNSLIQQYDTLHDIDGNIYKTILIGNAK
jgi:hypothetical protein